MVLRANSLTFSYSSDQSLLNGLSLSLSAGAKVALTGPNGSGKSTLLRLLAGNREPDSGHVIGTQVTAILEQHFRSGSEPASGGELRIEALREIFESGAAVILLDEPTNDLDQDAREWLKNTILGCSSSMLLVSHDPMILDLVDEIWELRQGKVSKHPAGFRGYVERLEEEEAKLTREIDSLTAETRRAQARARGVVEKQMKRMSHGRKAAAKENLPKIVQGARKRQAQVTLARVTSTQEERVEQVNCQLLEARRRLRSLTLFEWDSGATRPAAAKSLVKLQNVRLPGFHRDLNFEMAGPRRVHLKGKNGSGKSTLLHALANDPEANARIEGTLALSVPFLLFDQKLLQFTSDDLLWKWFHEKTLLDLSMARIVLGRLGFEQEEQLRPVSGLSGGERVRLEIALALHAKESPQILLLDEPTNHLDLESRRILLRFVETFEGGIIVVSHDSHFLASIGFEEVIDLDSYYS